MNWAPAATQEDLEKFKQVSELMKKIGIPFTPCGYNKYGPHHDGSISMIMAV